MLLLVAVALLAGALTRALGLGFSLVLAPAAAATLPADEAVCLVLAAGAGLNAALLLAEGGLAFPRGVRALVAGGVAGQSAAAAAAIGALASGPLRIVAGAALLAGCAATALGGPHRARRAPRPRPAAAALPAGVAIGGVGFLTGITGPFAAVWLAPGSAGGAPLRRSVFAATALLSASGLALQAAFGAGAEAALDGVQRAALLAPALAAGALAAAPAAARLRGRPHRLAVAAVAAAGAVALLAG